MAIIEKSLKGISRKKLGNVVFYTQWGRNILRTKSLTVFDPCTPAQQACRSRFKKLAQLLRQALNCINTAYAGSGQNMHAFNHLMSINMKKCWIGDTTAIDPTIFILCDNNGSFFNNVALTSTVPNTITATFNSNAQNPDEENDPVKAYGFYPDGNQIWQFDQTAIRTTGTITLSRPNISSLKIAIYLECLDRINLINDNPKHIIKYIGTVNVL
jgi:hypothetical protein